MQFVRNRVQLLYRINSRVDEVESVNGLRTKLGRDVDLAGYRHSRGGCCRLSIDLPILSPAPRSLALTFSALLQEDRDTIYNGISPLASVAHDRVILRRVLERKPPVTNRAYNQLQGFSKSRQRLHESSVSRREKSEAMLRVGLTGGLGSGKSTVAGIFVSLGAHVLEADKVGRELMKPGQSVYAAIVKEFGPEILKSDGTLDRRLLADLAFRQNRLADLNRIVHPAVIAAQQEWVEHLSTKDPSAVCVVESALIFEADQQGTVPGWRQRFDRIVLVTAPVKLRVSRYVERMKHQPNAQSEAELEADARSRLAAQMPDSEKIPFADYIINNGGSLEETRLQAEAIFTELAVAARV